MAWRFVTCLSSRDAIDYLLYDLPSADGKVNNSRDTEAGIQTRRSNGNNVLPSDNEETLLLSGTTTQLGRSHGSPGPSCFGTDERIDSTAEPDDNEEFTSSFQNLNALEVAAVTNAKKFLSQRVIQKIIGSIWRGDIIFWETLSVHSVKQAKIYNKR